jgi:hypothetical protein
MTFVLHKGSGWQVLEKSMKSTSALLFGLLILASCQDADKSYDAIHGPENVLGAPLFSDANRQQDATNRQLIELAKRDSLFFIKKKAVVGDSVVANAKDSSTASPSPDTAAILKSDAPLGTPAVHLAAKAAAAPTPKDTKAKAHK